MGFYMIWIDSGHDIWNHYNSKILITYYIYMNSEPCWRTWMDMVLAFLPQEFVIVHHFSILFFCCIWSKPGCWTAKRLLDATVASDTSRYVSGSFQELCASHLREKADSWHASDMFRIVCVAPIECEATGGYPWIRDWMILVSICISQHVFGF